jgi:hypothetical protein
MRQEQTAKQPNSYQIFLQKLEENLEREIESKIKSSQDLEQEQKDLRILEEKLAILDVSTDSIREIFIENGENKGVLLKEYQELCQKYSQESKQFITLEERKRWKYSPKEKEFVLNVILEIKSTLEKELLLKKASLINHRIKAITGTEEVIGIIDWFKSERSRCGLGEVMNKIANNEYYKKDTPVREMDELRQEFEDKYQKIIRKLKFDPDKKREFIKNCGIKIFYLGKVPEDEFLDEFNQLRFLSSNQGNALVKDLVERKIQELEREKKDLQWRQKQIIQDLKPFYSPYSYPIIWAIPGKRKLEDGQEIDDFKYGSKKRKKEVYKPYTEIHKALIDANWAIRDGEDLAPNYITAHILFIVSDRPHKPNHEESYDGSRTYIDFPINIEWRGDWSEDDILGSDKSLGRGESMKAPKRSHSEKALERFLKDQDKVRNIVAILKEKLLSKFGQNDEFKIYEVNLFLNSNKNICNSDADDCEGVLKRLQSSKSDSSFLALLKAELKIQGLKSLTSSNHQFPRMLISVSAYDHYTAYCSSRLCLDAEGPLQDQEYDQDLLGIAIDTKSLSGKVILSADEISINPDFEYRKKFRKEETYKSARKSRARDITLREEGIPFYSAFTSAGGDEDLLSEEQRKKYQLPKSFDDVDNIRPKTSIIDSTAQSLIGKRARYE